MLSEAGSISPIKNVPNQNYNPLVELPINIDNITNCDAILVTHTHRDHFDEEAAKLLPKNIPIFCQPEDEIKLQSYGFTDVQPIRTTHIWNNIHFDRTKGKHGHGIISMKMAPVSGFVISFQEEPSVYISGDTVWYKEIKKTIEKFTPQVVVCNCGGAQLSFGRPITMSTKDVHEICGRYANIKVVAVHMDAWNHCRLSRQALKNYIIDNNINANVFIPRDGELLQF
jgi:L-ascorbate metabolism protein UlaG (beta-lactamase superfamily)